MYFIIQPFHFCSHETHLKIILYFQNERLTDFIHDGNNKHTLFQYFIQVQLYFSFQSFERKFYSFQSLWFPKYLSIKTQSVWVFLQRTASLIIFYMKLCKLKCTAVLCYKLFEITFNSMHFLAFQDFKNGVLTHY